MRGKYLFTKGGKHRRVYSRQLKAKTVTARCPDCFVVGPHKIDSEHKDIVCQSCGLVNDYPSRLFSGRNDPLQYEKQINEENKRFEKDYPDLHKRAAARQAGIEKPDAEVTFKTQLDTSPYKFRIGANGKGYYERYVLYYVDKDEFGESLYLIQDLQIREPQNKLTAEDLSRYFATKYKRNFFKKEKAEEIAEDLNKAYSEKYVP